MSTPTESDRQCARNILAGFARLNPPADFMEDQVANHIAAHVERENARLRGEAETLFKWSELLARELESALSLTGRFYDYGVGRQTIEQYRAASVALRQPTPT